MHRRFNRLDPRNVIPSRHCIFIRGLPGNTDASKLKEIFIKDVGSSCSVDFFSASENGTKLSIAIRFESHEAAKETLLKYNGKKLLGYLVQITWFKDLKKGRTRSPVSGGYRRHEGQFRGRGTFRGTIRGQIRAMYDRRQRGFDERLDRRRERSSASSNGNKESARNHEDLQHSGECTPLGSESRSRSLSRSRDFKEDHVEDTLPAGYNTSKIKRKSAHSKNIERQDLPTKRRLMHNSTRLLSRSSHSGASSGSHSSSSSSGSSESSSVDRLEEKNRMFKKKWNKDSYSSIMQLKGGSPDDSVSKSTFNAGKIVLNGFDSSITQLKRSLIAHDDNQEAPIYNENSSTEVPNKPVLSMASNFFNSFIAEPDLDSANDDNICIGGGSVAYQATDDAELGSSLVSGLIHLNKRVSRMPTNEQHKDKSQLARGESIGRTNYLLEERLPGKRQRINSPQLSRNDNVHRSGSSGSLSSGPVVKRRRGRKKVKRSSMGNEVEGITHGSKENVRNHFSDRSMLSPVCDNARRFKQADVTPYLQKRHSPSPLFPAGAEVCNLRSGLNRVSVKEGFSDEDTIKRQFKYERSDSKHLSKKRTLSTRQRQVSSSEGSPLASPRTPPSIENSYFGDQLEVNSSNLLLKDDNASKEAATAGLLDLSSISKKSNQKDSFPVAVQRSSKKIESSVISSPVSLSRYNNEFTSVIDDASPPSITTRLIANRPITKLSVSNVPVFTEQKIDSKLVSQIDCTPEKAKPTVSLNKNNLLQKSIAVQMSTNEKLERISERKEALATEYKRDCETFTSVVRTLIGKDSELESRLLTLLREILQERGTRCVEELRGLIAESQEILNYEVLKENKLTDTSVHKTNFLV